jgi:hypothetical protein
MSKLDSEQRDLVRYLQHLQALPQVPEATRFAESLLTGNDRLSPVEQLEIYRQQFWLRHTSALLEDFPAVSGILGQAEWERLAESYLTTHAPTSWTLRDLGDRFAEHISARTETPHHALCTDMARLEWCYVELFDAPPGSALDPQKLENMAPEAWETARFVLSPVLRLLQVNYPVARLRRQLRAAAANEAPVLLPEPKPQNLVLYRDRELSLRCAALGEAEWLLLEQLQTGCSLLAACENVAQRAPGSQTLIETQVGTWFAAWGRKEWIADVVA